MGPSSTVTVAHGCFRFGAEARRGSIAGGTRRLGFSTDACERIRAPSRQVGSVRPLSVVAMMKFDSSWSIRAAAPGSPVVPAVACSKNA